GRVKSPHEKSAHGHPFARAHRGYFVFEQNSRRPVDGRDIGEATCRYPACLKRGFFRARNMFTSPESILGISSGIFSAIRFISEKYWRFSLCALSRCRFASHLVLLSEGFCVCSG